MTIATKSSRWTTSRRRCEAMRRFRDTAAALTFDDGYRSVLELADPLLRSHGLPYAMFVPSGLVDSGARMPTYVMQAALTFTDEPSVRLPGRRWAFKLRTADERERAIAHGTELLRSCRGGGARSPRRSSVALLTADRWEEIDASFASEDVLGLGRPPQMAEMGSPSDRTRATTRCSMSGSLWTEIDEQVRRRRRRSRSALGALVGTSASPRTPPRPLPRRRRGRREPLATLRPS